MRELTELLRLVEVVLLRLMVSSACVVYGGVTSSLECPAVCVPAETAANVLVSVRFAQNARARSESVASIGGVVLRVMVSSACDAYGGVTSSLEYPAVCGAAETASLAEVLAFGDLLDDLGSDRRFWKLSSGRVCCPVGSLVGWVGACGLVRGVKLQA